MQTSLFALPVAIALGGPAIVVGQAPLEAAPQVVVQEELTDSPGLPTLCAVHSQDPFLAEVSRARDLADPASASDALDALEPEARRIAAESPSDAAAQYRLAAVLGARLDFEHGREKMTGAGEVREQAQRVLDLDPSHAGASYMLGRIHSSIMRMSGFKRFMAKQLYGGDALEGASWDEARRLLEVAVSEDPCVPEHHYELARVYEARGDDEGAAREIAAVRELTLDTTDRRAARLRERVDELSRKL